jgi:gas vesicle protein
MMGEFITGVLVGAIIYGAVTAIDLFVNRVFR